MPNTETDKLNQLPRTGTDGSYTVNDNITTFKVYVQNINDATLQRNKL